MIPSSKLPGNAENEESLLLDTSSEIFLSFSPFKMMEITPATKLNERIPKANNKFDCNGIIADPIKAKKHMMRYLIFFFSILPLPIFQIIVLLNFSESLFYFFSWMKSSILTSSALSPLYVKVNILLSVIEPI